MIETAWGISNFSTAYASSPFPISRSRRAPSRVGTGAISFIFKCCPILRPTTASSWMHLSKSFRKKRSKSFCTARPSNRFRILTLTNAVGEELAKVINQKACPECAGARLRVEARHVKVGNGSQQRAIYEIASTPLRETLAFFQNQKLKGAKKEIADRIIKEIISRLAFLNNVGLDYLSLERSAAS